jgi:hypothetical protein
VITNRRHFMAVLTEYVAHFSDHRPHRALNQAAPRGSPPPPASPSPIHLRARDLLDGLIRDCCVVRSRACEIVDPGWSDRLDQLVEGSHHLQCRGLFDAEFVVAAAEVLHERVPGADHPRAAELFETAHRP